MKNILLILILQISYFFIQAEEFPYTVIAPNGLSVRAKPSVNSEQITTVPFGELVSSENYGTYDKLDTIDGTIGFWMKIKYKSISGFMFSGFLVSEDMFPLSREVSIPYIVLDEWAEYSETGTYCPGFYDPYRYSPNMFWYGIKVLDSTTIITKTNVIPEYNPNRWDKSDTIMFDVKLKVDNQENFDFVFGSKLKIKPCEIKSKKYYGLDSKVGIFIYPEQIIMIDPVNAGYSLQGSETVSIVESSENKINRKYAINLLHYSDTILNVNMNKVFNLRRSARIHAGYKNPQLIWSGDINNDGNPDFILKHQTMKDSCGSESFLYFVISQVENGIIEYYETSTGIDVQKIK